MKRAVFNTFNFAPSFLGPTLNMLQEAIDDGEEVYYVTCMKSFASCGFNTFRQRYMCDICQYRFDRVKPQIMGPFQVIELSSLFQEVDFIEADRFISGACTIDKQMYYENFDVGESVLSSYISKTRDRDLELARNRNVLTELARQTIVVYSAVKRFLRERSIDQLVLFNGRWDYYRAAFRAAQDLGIPCLVYENLREGGYIETFENAFPHIIRNKQNNYNSFWVQNPDLAFKKEVARTFFERKRNGEAIVDKAYATNQERSFIPPVIDLKKKLIVLFTSSDDETAAIGGDEYTNPFFTDQADGIVYLAELAGNILTDYNLVIRMHPNLAGLDFDYLKPVYALKDKYPNVFVIAPESKVDSYALIDRASKIISFGSSIGMEANYWRKPVILIAKAFYYYSDLAYIPKNKDEILNLLTNELAPKEIESSEKIAYYLMKGGIKSTYYNYKYKSEYYFNKFRIDYIPFVMRNYFRLLKLLSVKN